MARNAWLADEILSVALERELTPLEDDEEEALARARADATRQSATSIAVVRRRILRGGSRALVSNR